MAKRGADDQISRDDAPSDNEEDPGVRTEALKPVEGRKIRGIPKRKGLGGDAPAAPAPAAPAFGAAPTGGFSFGGPSNGASSAPAPPPLAASGGFGGFSFGSKLSAPPAAPAAPASTPAPFSFTASAPAPAPADADEKMDDEPAPKPAFGAFSFGGAKAPEKAADRAAAAGKPAFGGFSFGKPSAPASSSAAKEPAPPAASANRSSSGIGPSQPKPPNEGEISYYTALRGLNSSFLSFMSKSIASNEFLDLTSVLPSLLEQYKSHLAEASSKAGWKPATPAPAAVSAPKPTETKAAPASSAAPAPTPAFAFSAPVATPKKPSAAVNAAAAAVLADDEKEKEKEKVPEKSPQKFSFSSAPKSGSLFSFAPSGPLAPTTPDSKTFSSSTTTPADAPAKLGKFGPDGGTPQLSFGGASASPAATKSSFSFGTPSSSAGFSFGSAGEEKKGEDKGFSFGKPPDKPFSFGSSSDKPADKAAVPAFGGFGSSSGSGFSFGASPASSDKPADKPAFSFGASSQPAAPAAAKPFSFGSTPSASAFSFGGNSASGSGSTTPAPPAAAEGDAPEETSKNLAEAEGAGEENEETVIEQRGRLYVLEGGKHVVAGLGQLKLKRAKDGGKRRLLMRADGSGTVVLNMGLQASFKPAADDKKVKFLGFDLEGNIKPYTLQVKTKEAATAVVDAMNQEVEALKAE